MAQASLQLEGMGRVCDWHLQSSLCRKGCSRDAEGSGNWRIGSMARGFSLRSEPVIWLDPKYGEAHAAFEMYLQKKGVLIPRHFIVDEKTGGTLEEKLTVRHSRARSSVPFTSRIPSVLYLLRLFPMITERISRVPMFTSGAIFTYR